MSALDPLVALTLAAELTDAATAMSCACAETARRLNAAAEYALTHPGDAERLAAVRAELAAIGFTDVESHADPAKAIRALAERCAELERRFGVDC